MFRKMCIILIGFVICVVIFFHGGKEVTNRVVSYNGDKFMVSVDGVEVDTLPTKGEYYLVDYTCRSKDTVVSWDNDSYELKVSNSNNKGSIACYLDFQSSPKLADMAVGSYVDYVGTNGCVGDSCKGKNVNSTSINEGGYCYSNKYQFYTGGWRLAYSKDGHAYLISAGATDCMCTDSNKKSSNGECNGNDTTFGAINHIKNLNSIALLYCNKKYADGGVCSDNTSWAMNDIDFENMTGNSLGNCLSRFSDKVCGYTNDLIDIGSYYWFASANSMEAYNTNFWSSSGRFLFNSTSNPSYGVRPVLRLESSVMVTGGKGTVDEPYQISNYAFWIEDGTDVIKNENKKSIELTMLGDDVSTMCINVDSSGCSNYIEFSEIYTLDFSLEEEGEKNVYVYYKNKSGDIIASMNRKVVLESTVQE